ncbi:MAG TPA: Hsp70 family protein, partial [Bacillota bacterium]|nr:Hsp70 family protein [Bacillota bacterium]
EMIRRVTGKEPTLSVNPDEAVALGAAIYAGVILAGRGDPEVVLSEAGRRLRDTRIEDVTSHSYGVLLVDSRTGDDINEIMIAKNSPIPASRTAMYYVHEDGQSSVELVVLQGEDRNPANCNEIGRVVLPLGGSKPRNYPIDVTYEYDSNMIMHATIKDPQTNVQKSLQITQQGRLSNAEVEEKRETMQEVEVV